MIAEMVIASERTGGAVGFAPILMGSDGKPVLLSDLMKSIIHRVNVDKMEKAMPELSRDQIIGAMKFLQALTEISHT